MPDSLEERLEAEIRAIEKRFRSLLREWAEARPLAARWTFSGRALRWHVALEDVLEPDVDIEVAPPVYVVRARGRSDTRYVSVLPVPSQFDAGRPRIRAERDYLEIVVQRRRSRGPRR